MTAVEEGEPAAVVSEHQAAEDMLGVASIGLSGFGFLTLLRLADSRDRAPASALGLFLVTSLATISGTLFGLVAVRRARATELSSKGLVLGASGAALGFITTVLNLNFMRTRRRL